MCFGEEKGILAIGDVDEGLYVTRFEIMLWIEGKYFVGWSSIYLILSCEDERNDGRNSQFTVSINWL